MHSSADRLKELGLRASKARTTVLDVLTGATTPMTIEDIHEASKKVCDLVTIYRTLALLEEKGLAKKVIIDDSRAHYESASLPHHHHLRCTSCDTIVDVHVCLPTSSINKALGQARGFASIENHSLEFIGTCLPCSRSK